MRGTGSSTPRLTPAIQSPQPVWVNTAAPEGRIPHVTWRGLARTQNTPVFTIMRALRLGDGVDVAVGSHDRGTVPQRNRGDQAVDQLVNRTGRSHPA